MFLLPDARRLVVPVFALVLLAGAALVLTGTGSPSRAASGLGGHAQVHRLEVAWIPESGLASARVHTDAGVALDFEGRRAEDVRSLLAIAQSFSQRNTRLFVEVKDDRILSFQLSVP